MQCLYCNIRLGWNCLHVANPLDYRKRAKNTEVKSFIADALQDLRKVSEKKFFGIFGGKLLTVF